MSEKITVLSCTMDQQVECHRSHHLALMSHNQQHGSCMQFFFQGEEIKKKILRTLVSLRPYSLQITSTAVDLGLSRL